MADNKKIFLGFKQVTAKTFETTTDKQGYFWLVRDVEKGTADIWFGNKHYSSFDPTIASDVETLKELVNGILSDVYTKEGVDELLKGKVDVEAFESYKEEIVEALSKKLEASDLEGYAKTDDVVSNETFEGYKEEVSIELDKKANSLDVYTKEEVDSKLSVINRFVNIEIVDELPTENISDTTIYLVKDKESEGDLYTEFIYLNGVWENLGKQTVDFSKYSTTEEINALLEVLTTNLNNRIDEVEKTVTDSLTDLSKKVKNVEDELANKLEASDLEGYENKIEKVTLFGNEINVVDKTIAIDFQSDDVKLGVDITTVEKDEETGEETEVVVFSKDKTVSETLQGIYASLKSGLSGGVTSVTAADDSVKVTGDTNNKEIKVQVSAAADNRLSIRTVDGEKGLYVAPLYYDGDDTDVE
jgi:hypothetical protein